ncbi:phosphoinositide 3-kinase regulatory subunit 6 isoform X2 [Centroberyx affinis]|uniref:phosphoinositide 3-kinase regulatory subunit 6 isoform X2 n=1 Tax=Centroberyx affinis TaxID=166261 RepID=UPI003A5BCAFD
MFDPTAGVDGSSAVESSLYNSVQAVLRELNSQSTSHEGMLRWTLHKKVESHPSNTVSLIRVLVKELGKRVYDCLRKLLILPLPYSAVALSNLRSIKMEMTTPGALYQRRVIAEQNLKNEHFTLREKVFVLADPAVFSGPLGAAVRADLQMAGPFTDTLTQEKAVVLHTLQTGLGTACQSSALVQALQALGEHAVQKYFQEVVVAVEQSIEHGAVGHVGYLNRLQHIYRDILTASKGGTAQVDHGSVCSAAMPTPEINFLLWHNEEDLWNALTNFALGSCPNPVTDKEEDKRDSVLSVDSGIEKDLKDLELDDKEQLPARNLATAFTRRPALKSMKPADKLTLMREKMEAYPSSSPPLKEERGLTARVVVMGDDRALGRLTKVYRSIRERESKHLILTKKLNLQLYYIPVTDAAPSLSSPGSPCQDEGKLSLASLLGRVDPWYDSNINSLGAVIPKLAEMHSNHSKPNLFLLDTLSYYLRCGMQPVNLPFYSVKITRSSYNVSSTVEEVFVSRLQADFPEFRQLKEKLLKESSVRRKRKTVQVFGAVVSVSYKKISLSRRFVVRGMAPTTCGVVITAESPTDIAGQNYLTVSFDSMNPRYYTIQTQNISIRTLEQRTFTVCLDKDSRRTYNDVQRIDISPCLDPGYSLQSSGKSKFAVRNEQEPAPSKYGNRVLSLPINTFSGVTL